jgi:hypothetical protein
VREHYCVFLAAFAVSALAGMANLLRGNVPVTLKAVASYSLNSGMLGLGVALLWYSQFRENIHFLVGLCVLAGLGGMATVDFATGGVRKLMGALLGSPGESK